MPVSVLQKSAVLLAALTLVAAVGGTAVYAEEAALPPAAPAEPAPQPEAPPPAEAAPPPAPEATPTPTPEPTPEPTPAAPAFLALNYTASSGTIRRGDKVDLTVTLKDPARLTRDFRREDYDFSKLIDSFSDCTPEVEVVSAPDEPVTVRLRCAGVSYSGVGQSLRFSVAGKGGAAQTVEITVTQAVVYTEPEQPAPTPTPGPKEQPAPPVIVTRSALSAPLKADETADIVVTFQNGGKTKMVAPQAVFTAAEPLLVTSDTSSFLLGDIEPGQSRSVTVRVRAGKEMAAAAQSLQVEVKYSYDNAGTLTAATAADVIHLDSTPTATPTPGPDAATPNIVIRDFSYGSGNITAGSRFTLAFAFQNVGRLRVENVVASVDGGENFALDGGTSTFYYEALPAKGEQKQTVPLQALPTAKNGAQAVTVQFKYEYVDGGKRTAATSEVKVAVPVVQQDRFQVNAPVLPESCAVGEECVLSLNYVNRGKTEVSNVEATVEGEGFEATAKTQYIGNLAAGTNGTIGFALTPSRSGKLRVVLKVSYEDPNLQPQTKEFPVELTVAESAQPDDLPPDDEAEHKSFPWPLLALLPLGGVIAGAVVVLRRGGKGKAAQPAPAWEPWPEEEPADQTDGPDTPEV